MIYNSGKSNPAGGVIILSGNVKCDSFVNEMSFLSQQLQNMLRGMNI